MDRLSAVLGSSAEREAFRTGLYEHIKRVVDICGATLLSALFAPIFVVISFLIVLTMPGPILFCQERVGQFGRSIRVLKFRTMVVDAEAILRRDPQLYDAYVRGGYKLDPSMDPRITPLGRFLRKTSLDELPQLFNVLVGNMSLVGPRPVLQSELANYGDHSELLVLAKPGITGWWQVSGRSGVNYPERIDLELYYLRNRSLWFDIKILLLTVPSVLMGKGAQ